MKAPKPKHCTVEDCADPVHAKEMCQVHYFRHYRHGSTDAQPRSGKSATAHQESMRRRYSQLDACPRCNALPGMPCREAAALSTVRRSLQKPHPGRPEKPLVDADPPRL